MSAFCFLIMANPRKAISADSFEQQVVELLDARFPVRTQQPAVVHHRRVATDSKLFDDDTVLAVDLPPELNQSLDASGGGSSSPTW